MSQSGQASPLGEQNGHEKLNALVSGQSSAIGEGHQGPNPAGNRLPLSLGATQILPPKASGHHSPQRSPADDTFSDGNSKGTASSTTSAAGDSKAGPQAKEDARAPDRRVSIAPSNKETASEAQFTNPVVSRQSIAERQIEHARVRKGEVKILLESYLPGYLFTVNPDLLKNPKGKPHPTLLDQEISKAIQSAEVNLYLSHITDVGKKIEFLQGYQAIKDKYEGKNSRIARDMKKYAHTKPMLKEVIIDGKPVKQPVTHTKEKTYKDKDGKERIKHKAGDTKWDAKKLPPLGEDLLKEKDDQIEDLLARLEKVKVGLEPSRYTIDKTPHLRTSDSMGQSAA